MNFYADTFTFDETLSFPRFHSDDRRLGWFDLFGDHANEIQDLNVVRIYNKGTITAWHKHQHQTDFWFVVSGGLQVGLSADKTPNYPSWTYLNPEYGSVLRIPPDTWHGYKSLQDNTILIYGLTNKYDGSDEERYSVDTAVWDLGAR